MPDLTESPTVPRCVYCGDGPSEGGYWWYHHPGPEQLIVHGKCAEAKRGDADG